MPGSLADSDERSLGMLIIGVLIALVLFLFAGLALHVVMAISNAASGERYRGWAVKSFVLAIVFGLMLSFAAIFLYRAVTGEMVDPFGIQVLVLCTVGFSALTVVARPWAPS